MAHLGIVRRSQAQRVNSAARIVSNTRKFDRGLTHFRRSQLHWLDVVDRVRFRVCVQVFRCLHKMAPEYLSTYTANPSPAFLVVATCDRLTVVISTSHVHVKLASYRGRSFAYAGPSNWNSLPDHLRDNSLTLSSFERHLKTFLFSFYRLSHAARLGMYKFTVIMRPSSLGGGRILRRTLSVRLSVCLSVCPCRYRVSRRAT